MKRFLLLLLFIPSVWAADPVVVGAPTVAPLQPAPTMTAPTTPKTTLVNQAQVPVVDESPQALELGLQAAFSEVMIKSTGNANIMQVSSVALVAKNVSQIVQGYSYTQIGNAAPPTKPQTMLNVTFDPNAISQLIELVNQSTQNQNNNAPTQPVSSNVTLLVTGVKNMSDYAALLQALRETSNVTNVAVNNVDPDRISLTITVSGGAPALKAGLVSNTHLRALETTTTELNAPLFYLWVSQP